MWMPLLLMVWMFRSPTCGWGRVAANTGRGQGATAGVQPACLHDRSPAAIPISSCVTASKETTYHTLRGHITWRFIVMRCVLRCYSKQIRLFLFLCNRNLELYNSRPTFVHVLFIYFCYHVETSWFFSNPSARLCGQVIKRSGIKIRLRRLARLTSYSWFSSVPS